MTSGLLHIHSKHYIHRDISPENILISRCGSKLFISDFGLCQKVSPKESDIQHSREQVGKDNWEAPELLNQKGVHGTQSDIFALGCTIYYLVTKGKHPFQTGTVTEIPQKILDNKWSLDGKKHCQ